MTNRDLCLDPQSDSDRDLLGMGGLGMVYPDLDRFCSRCPTADSLPQGAREI